MSDHSVDDRVLFCAGDFAVLEAALWRELDSVRAREPLAPVMILVPTNLLRRHLLAAQAQRGGCINVQFLTLLDLCRKLGEPALAAAGRGPLPDLAGELLARRVALAARPASFAAIADRPGLHRALLGTIADLKEAGHTPADLRKCLARRPCQRSPALPKIRDLAACWEAYEARLAELALYDDADLMAAATAAAPGEPWLAQAVALFVYGFYDFNELQRRLAAASAAGRLARAFVPYAPGSEAFRYATPTLEWLVSQGFRANAEAVSPPPSAAAEGAKDELAALRQSLFEAPSGGAVSAGRLRILSAPDEAREVREIIRAAVAGARGTGLRPVSATGETPVPPTPVAPGTPLPRVGVLLRQAATYAPLFAEECRAGQLEAYHHSPPPLSASRAGRSFLLLLRLIGPDGGGGTGLRPVSVAGGTGLRPVAATGETPAPPTPLSPMPELCRSDVMEFITYADLAVEGEPNIADWDLLSIHAGVVKGRASWQQRLANLRRSLQQEDDGDDADDSEQGSSRGAFGNRERLAALDALASFLEDFFPAIEGVPTAGTWGQLVEAALGLYRRFVRATDEREAVAEAIAQLRALDASGEPADMGTLARLARETLEGARPPRPPFGSRGPAIIGLMEARGLTFDVVCIPGLVENAFPAFIGADPLLSDSERTLLSKAGLPLPLKSSRDAEERLLFRLAVGAGSARVLLTYPRMETTSGRQRVPSHFLLRAVEAVTGKRADYEALDEFVGGGRISASAFAPAEPDAAWRAAEYDLAVVRSVLAASRKPGTGKGLAAELGYLTEVAATFAPAWRAEARRWEEPSFTHYDGVLTDASALAALAERLGPGPWRTSASALEQYARCPFQFFLRHILHVEPLEEPEAVCRISGLDRGRVLHRVLCAFLRRARDDARLPLKPEDAQRIVDAARTSFADFEQHGLVGFPALWQLEKESLEQDLRRFAEDEARDPSGFLPAHFEAAFGCPPREPEDEPWSRDGLRLELDEAVAICLTGRIDRIDLTPDGKRGRVVDYKTGKVPKGLQDNDFAGGQALQLPIYLLAAEALFARTIIELAQYRYVTRSGDYVARTFTREALAERRAVFMSMLNTIAEGVRKGRFFVGLPDTGNCDFCDFRAVCGPFAAAVSQFKAGDPAVQRFLRMREAE